MTLLRYFETQFASQHLGGKAAKTVEVHRCAVNSLCTFVGGDPRLGEVHAAVLFHHEQALIDAGRSRETARLYRIHLFRIMRTARPGDFIRRSHGVRHIKPTWATVPDVRLSLQDFIDNVYAPRRVNLSDSSRMQLHYAANSLAKSHGRTIFIDELQEDLILTWQQDVREKRSIRTLKSQRMAILTLWRFAHKRDYCEAAVPDFDSIRAPKKIPKAWTLREVERIVQACAALDGNISGTDIPRKLWWTSLHLFLYDSGARIGAALAVAPEDVDLRGRVCVLRADAAKTGLEQIAHLSPQTMKAIASIHDPSRDTLWPWTRHRRSLWTEYKGILRAAGVDSGSGVAFHRMRKTHATMAVLAAGWETASRDLGHTSVEMTKAYVDLRQIQQQPVSLPRLTIHKGT